MTELKIVCKTCGGDLDFIDNQWGGLSPACQNVNCEQYAIPNDVVEFDVEETFHPFIGEILEYIKILKIDLNERDQTIRKVIKNNDKYCEELIERAEKAEAKVLQTENNQNLDCESCKFNFANLKESYANSIAELKTQNATLVETNSWAKAYVDLYEDIRVHTEEEKPNEDGWYYCYSVSKEGYEYIMPIYYNNSSGWRMFSGRVLLWQKSAILEKTKALTEKRNSFWVEMKGKNFYYRCRE